MKLSDYAKKMGVRYETAWRWFRDGKIQGRRIGRHTIIITEGEEVPPTTPHASSRVAIYTRVSAAENKPNLDTQAERLVTYCAAKGYQVHCIVKEVGSGVNDSRPKLLALLADPSISIIVVEHKDRLTRFGYRYIETLLAVQGRQIEVVNLASTETEDLLTDLTSSIYSFCARLYGQRRAKRRTERVIAALTATGTED